MRNFKRKLNSQRGASITWALLIFLVCAVIGSAVLVAGTAAAGRMAKIAENDQRYYAVNSAARMLIDMIDDKTVEIEKTDDTYTNRATGDAIVETTKLNSIPLEAAYYFAFNPSATSRASYSFDVSSLGTPSLNVTVGEVIEEDGSMILTLVGNGESGNPYSLKIYFNLDKSVDISDEETTIYQYTWHLRDIEVVGSQRWST